MIDFTPGGEDYRETETRAVRIYPGILRKGMHLHSTPEYAAWLRPDGELVVSTEDRFLSRASGAARRILDYMQAPGLLVTKEHLPGVSEFYDRTLGWPVDLEGEIIDPEVVIDLRLPDSVLLTQRHFSPVIIKRPADDGAVSVAFKDPRYASTQY
jgi:hypothetical protein